MIVQLTNQQASPFRLSILWERGELLLGATFALLLRIPPAATSLAPRIPAIAFEFH